MLNPAIKLPLHNLAVSHVRGFSAYGCEPLLMGHALETPKYLYHRDNHVRDPFCLFQYTLSGGGIFRDAAGKEHRLEAGLGFLVRAPSETSYWTVPGQSWEFLFLLTRGDVVSFHTQELLDAYGHIFDLALDSAPVQRMAEICHYALGNPTLDVYTLSEMTYRFFMALRRSASPVAEQVPAPLLKAKSLIESNYFDFNLGVEELADASGVSRYHFSREFKKYFGQSPYAALLHHRLRTAMDLLVETDRPLKQIAFEVGFRDYPYFGRMFRQVMGESPGEVRRRRTRFGTRQQRTAQA